MKMKKIGYKKMSSDNQDLKKLIFLQIFVHHLLPVFSEKFGYDGAKTKFL